MSAWNKNVTQVVGKNKNLHLKLKFFEFTLAQVLTFWVIWMLSHYWMNPIVILWTYGTIVATAHVFVWLCSKSDIESYNSETWPSAHQIHTDNQAPD